MSKNNKRPPKGFSEEALQRRVAWIKETSNQDYSQILTNNTEDLPGIIEQHIGYHTIPMAVASPLLLNGTYAQGNFMLPICTVEGTLVYSLTRGMMATADSGGITVRYQGQKLSRAPIFCFSSVTEVNPFIEFINNNVHDIRTVAESTTRYGKLLEINPTVLSTMVILEFIYSTGDAAGQNMVTIATHAACKFIKQKFPMKKIFSRIGLKL